MDITRGLVQRMANQIKQMKDEKYAGHIMFYRGDAKPKLIHPYPCSSIQSELNHTIIPGI